MPFGDQLLAKVHLVLVEPVQVRVVCANDNCAHIISKAQIENWILIDLSKGIIIGGRLN